MKIIEVLESPDAGKTTALKEISAKLERMGISNEFIIETRGKNLFPKSERGTIAYNCKVAGITCQRIKEVIEKSDAEFILVDKGYVDFLYWNYYYYCNGKCSKEEMEEANQLFKEMYLMPDVIVVMVCNAEIATARCEDPVETRTVKVQKSVDSLKSFYNSWEHTPKYLLDTSYMSKDEMVDELSQIIFS